MPAGLFAVSANTRGPAKSIPRRNRAAHFSACWRAPADEVDFSNAFFS